MKKNVIISLADSKYFDLLNELIDSIKRFKESERVAFCVLDAGLNDCLLYTSPSPRDRLLSRMPSSA